jgi:hypothetical protein
MKKAGRTWAIVGDHGQIRLMMEGPDLSEVLWSTGDLPNGGKVSKVRA